MRILLITAYFPPDVGSASHLFFELGGAFKKRGHEVEVVTGFPAYHAMGDLSRYERRRWMNERMEGMNVTRIRVPELARDTPLGRGLWQFTCAGAFALAGLRIARPDAALVYSPPLPLGLTALALRLLRGTPHVINVQDLFPQSAIDLGLLRSRPLIRMFERLESLVYRRADAVTVHSDGNRRHVLEHGGPPATTEVMHNSVDTGHIRPGPRENELSRELGLDGRFVASFAGIMGRSQDLGVILDAAKRLEDDGRILFLLAGEGVEKERMMAKSGEMGLDNVRWMPMLPRERYPLLLHLSDVCLTTLHADVKTPVVPSKILSAMAAGRPVVASLDLEGDAPRLIEEAGAGYSLPPEDGAALADTLRRLAGDSELCRRLGESGRRYAEKHLSPESVAVRYEGIFDRITGSRMSAATRSGEGAGESGGA